MWPKEQPPSMAGTTSSCNKGDQIKGRRQLSRFNSLRPLYPLRFLSSYPTTVNSPCTSFNCRRAGIFSITAPNALRTWLLVSRIPNPRETAWIT